MPANSETATRLASGGTPATMIQVENYAAEVSAVPMDDLEEFLRDPLGYGTYDWSDPLTLDEFAVRHPMHEHTLVVLT